MPKGLGGYQPDTKSASSRRADFDLQRRLSAAEHIIAEPVNWPDGYPTYDPRYVNVSGDTMTDKLKIEAPAEQLSLYRIGADGPHIGFYNQDKTTRNTYVQGLPTSFVIEHATGEIKLNTGGGQVVAGGRLKVGGNQTTDDALHLLPGSGVWNLIRFQNSADAQVSYIGPQSGPGGNNEFRIYTVGNLNFLPGGVLRGVWESNGNLHLYKTGANPLVVGHEFHTSGRAWHTVDTATQYCVISTIVNGAASDIFHDFRRSSTRIGWIIQSGTTGVAYQSASDYRLKQELGPVPDALERLHRLRPVHFAWKSDGTEQDGFMAHEVAEVVPDAVNGEKDAVAAEDNEEAGVTAGDIIPQGLDNGRLVPLLVAAVQELSTEVRQLRAELAELKGAA